MPNVHGVKHEVKYSNGTIEIPMPEEERDCRDKTITRVGFTVYSCLLKLFTIAYRVSWLRANYNLTVQVLTLNLLYMVDCDCPSSFAKNR